MTNPGNKNLMDALHAQNDGVDFNRKDVLSIQKFSQLNAAPRRLI